MALWSFRHCATRPGRMAGSTGVLAGCGGTCFVSWKPAPWLNLDPDDADSALAQRKIMRQMSPAALRFASELPIVTLIAVVVLVVVKPF